MQHRAQDFRWPRRTVLVLGREKEGIPAALLGMLRSTVEIPQLGRIRSLNVHVSGTPCCARWWRGCLSGQSL